MKAKTPKKDVRKSLTPTKAAKSEEKTPDESQTEIVEKVIIQIPNEDCDTNAEQVTQEDGTETDMPKDHSNHSNTTLSSATQAETLDVKVEARRLLAEGVMPLVPPARRIWGKVESVALTPALYCPPPPQDGKN